MKKEKKNRILTYISNGVLVVLLFVASLLAVRNTCYTAVVVYGSSMAPTLAQGDYGYALKTKYAKTHLKRFDIVIFEREEKGGEKDLIKRVIALPGERCMFRGENCELYVGNEYIPQSFISLEKQKLTCDVSMRDLWIEVPEHCYLVLGDNRDNSKDSLHGLGFVDQNEIVGVLSVITARCGSVDVNGQVCGDKKIMPFLYF